MPARKATEAFDSLETATPKVDLVSPGPQVRVLENVVPEAKRLHQEEGLTVPEISEKLQVSYDVLNQVFLRSYKSTVDTVALFERQENVRLGIQ